MKKKVKIISDLEKAVIFCSSVGNNGNFIDGVLHCGNEELSATYNTDESLNVEVDLKILKKSFKAFEDSYFLTETEKTLVLSNEILSVSSISNQDSFESVPIPPQWELCDYFRWAMLMLCKIPKDTKEKLNTDYLYCSSKTIAATNRIILAEFALACELPKFMISKKMARAICKIKEYPKSIGINDNKISVHYENGTITEKRHNGNWIDYLKIIKCDNYEPIEKETLDAIENVLTFSKCYIELGNYEIKTECAKIAIAEALPKVRLPIDGAEILLSAARHWRIGEDCIWFRGGRMRGAFALNLGDDI